MEHFGSFPWTEVLSGILTTVLGYFTGRYRRITKDS